MKMKKVLGLILTVSLAAAGLAACGTQGSTVSKGGATGDKFYIGAMGPLTGSNAVYGQHVKDGAEIAVKEINAAGGINGKQIEFKYEDDEHDPEKAVNAYNNLKDWGMQLLMGAVTSGPSVAVAEETKNDSMFQITPSGSSQDVIKYDNAFQVCFTDPNQGVASAKYISNQKLASKVAVIYDSSDVYSSGIYAKFAEEAKNSNFEIVAAEAFTSDSKSDFSVQLQKAKDSGAELVFLPIYYQETTLILTQANDMGFDPIFFGCDGLDGILGVKNFDKALAEGVMLLTPFAADAPDEKTQNFVKQFKETYGEIPNQFGADAYDAIYIIKAAIETAGVTPDMSTSEICDALKSAITKITYDGVTGAGMTWAPTGEVNKEPRAVIIKNGTYQLFE
ncbi:MAG TPA: amino acid ABC transporter substrate-binding protein [Lachnospiraceae bacterium]|nr:amino acid ABC transporter substrate-binding protein [Lachnospiraceae bacterium]HBY71401.1 amino acid ABC transporter substrate-binding protein [Lachnospiraceae bacterium]HCA69183.1 amino acid ABC transporter substrate-binding protein [Lachnospiraceae bacterium]HCM14133.1 amino acid ABC transporter substrate-binding protein [Lachnospiraceae bacterium]HCR41402.1 amino acid ABC transporter substrate-binding protein [Lachnospiraceae bacterium]